MNLTNYTVLPKLNQYDYYFIHIPKNGGTAFERYFMSRHFGHHYLHEYPVAIWNKTLAILRNPLDRMVSIYNYSKMKKSYWHSDDKTTPYGPNPLHEYCTSHTFAQFVRDVCDNRFGEHIHLAEQYKFIVAPGNVVPGHILRFEDLDRDLSRFFGTNIKLERYNVTAIPNNNAHCFTSELKKLLHDKYEIDFKLYHFLLRHKKTNKIPPDFLGGYRSFL